MINFGNLCRSKTKGEIVMKIIKMMIGDRHIATVTESGMETFIKSHPFAPNLAEWYEACFYEVPNSDTFEERYELVLAGNYFCYLKPGLTLIAVEVDDG